MLFRLPAESVPSLAVPRADSCCLLGKFPGEASCHFYLVLTSALTPVYAMEAPRGWTRISLCSVLGDSADTHNRNERVCDVNNRETHQSPGFTVKTPQYEQHRVIISLGQEVGQAGL